MTLKKKLIVIHGPNLNLLGEREPSVYGRESLSELNLRLKKAAAERGALLRFFQSNGEGEIIDWLHHQRKWAQGIVINPGAYTHYSYAIRDAIASVGLPCVEVHLSDIHKREKFRRISVIAPVCLTQISGFGGESYLRGIDFLIKRMK